MYSEHPRSTTGTRNRKCPYIESTKQRSIHKINSCEDMILFCARINFSRACLHDPLQHYLHIHLPLSHHQPRNGSAASTTVCAAGITVPKPACGSILRHSLHMLFPSTTAAAAADPVWSYITTPLRTTSIRIHTSLPAHTLVLMPEVLETLLIAFSR
jgi:hypothetical protein